MTVQRNADHRRRRSIRLPGYDYTQPGAYFITICTYQRELLFGDVADGEMISNAYGQIVGEEWQKTAQLRPYVRLDAHVVMPNHFHGIVWITQDDSDGRGMARHAPITRRTPTAHHVPTTARHVPTTPHAPTREFGKPVAASLSTIVGAFKSAVTRRINQLRGTPGTPVWQRNYWEHVVRTDRALDAIRQYIADNPARWTLDRYHPAPTGTDPRAADLWRLLKE
jgi:REP element-mobilizing transposase RayT